MLPASNKSGERGPRPRLTVGGHKWLRASLLAGCPIFYGFSQIVDYRRLGFACVTDVRDSSTGMPARRSGADVSSDMPSRQGAGRGAMPPQGQYSAEPGSPGADFSGYGQPDTDELARRQPGTAPLPRTARQPQARLIAPGGRPRRPMPARPPPDGPPAAGQADRPGRPPPASDACQPARGRTGTGARGAERGRGRPDRTYRGHRDRAPRRQPGA